MKNYGYALEHADDSLKKDKDIVLAAVKQDGRALDYADDEFKKDVPSIVSKTDKTIITGYTQSENLSISFKNYTIKALEEVAVDNKPSLNIIQCLECLSLRVEVIRGQNHVKKGITNLEELNKALNRFNIKAEIVGREKNPFSIWKKMQKKNISFEQ